MTFMKRRHFLKFAGATLATAGLDQANFFRRASHYGRVAAQASPRKLALLIGINDYTKNASVLSSLRGCLTDVDLQYELLVHRFGFDPSNIVKITDDQPLKPTRKNIIDTFQSHLINQAEPGDVVVFHYSGHGALVLDPDPIYEGLSLNGTIVPSDGTPEGSDVVSDIMGRTLFLLMRSLKTDNVTAILDSCHSGGGLRGNTLVRSVNSAGRKRQVMPEEFELQDQLLKSASLSFEDFQQARTAGIARGVGLGSSQVSQLSFDIPQPGFFAGAFTYLLTRYLWQIPGSTSAASVRTNLVRSTQVKVAASHHNFSQIPRFQTVPGRDNLEKPIYFMLPERGSAEAVVHAVSDSGEITFWLGGVSSHLLSLSRSRMTFTLLNDNREPVGEIEQTKRFGLIGVGKLISGRALPGMLMRETVVGLPTNLQLKIGVDASLGTEQNRAIALLSESMISAQTGQSQLMVSAIDPQLPYDYIFGRMDENRHSQLVREGFDTALIPSVDTLLLFTPALEPVPLSFNHTSKTLTDSIAYLRLRLKVLLANKAIRALTAIKSELAVAGAIYAESDPIRAVAINQGVEAATQASSMPVSVFRAGETIRIRVENQSDNQAVYVSCIAIHSDGNMTVIYPNDWNAPEDAALIEPKTSIVLPRPEDENIRYAFALDKGKEVDFSEVVTITSTRSLRSTLRALQEIASNRSESRYSSISLQGGELNFLQDVLGDIDQLSRGGSVSSSEIGSDRVVVDSSAIAVFSTLVEIVKP
ncbi:MAG: caspase family protein [Phormidesmis sp.]